MPKTLGSSESAIATLRSESSELQGQLAELQQEHSELEVNARWKLEDHESEAKELESLVKKLELQKLELSKQAEDVIACKKEHQLRDEMYARECTSASHELALQRARTSEELRSSQAEVAEAENRVERLLKQLSDERQDNAELWREICIAKGVAGDAARPPWVIAEEKAAGKPNAWAASALRMHRELEQLEKWKAESTAVLQRMQSDMAMTQQSYKQQLEDNQRLQAHLEQMGRQARAAVTGMSAPSQSCVESLPLRPNSMLPSDPVLGLFGKGGTVAPGVGEDAALEHAAVNPGTPESLRGGKATASRGFSPACGAGVTFEAGLQSSGVGWPATPLGLDVSCNSGVHLPDTPAGLAGLFGLPTGPDVPERPDLPVPPRKAQKQNYASRSMAEDSETPGVVAPSPGQARGRPSRHVREGPVSGPFYEAYRARQGGSVGKTGGGPVRRESRGSTRSSSAPQGRASAVRRR